MRKYIILEKAVGETPLSCTEAWRAHNPQHQGISLAYAGRLDPMASGKLLILVGDECKNQTSYHSLDKEYEFSVLLGVSSDSHDVLGRLETSQKLSIGSGAQSALSEDSAIAKITPILQKLIGPIELPYPHFSAKTVQGKPLHTWTLENRLYEIEIPTKKSVVYELELTKTENINRNNLVDLALKKVNSIPPVTDLRKALGNDFRRADVRQDWSNIKNDNSLPDTYTIIHLRCLASSGTYMRSLAHLLGQKLNLPSLAWHIHRTKIGVYDPVRAHWISEY